MPWIIFLCPGVARINWIQNGPFAIMRALISYSICPFPAPTYTHSVYTAPNMVALKCPMPFYKQSHTLQTTVHNSLILLTINQAVNH